MGVKSDHPGVYGFLAALKLCAAAAADQRLSGPQVRLMNVLASHVDPDGSLCITTGRAAQLLGVSRPRVVAMIQGRKKRDKKTGESVVDAPGLQHFGYVTVKERRRPNGGDGANIYRLNLELVAHGLACPLQIVPGA